MKFSGKIWLMVILEAAISLKAELQPLSSKRTSMKTTGRLWMN